MSNKQIARALDLQLSTVKNHVHSLLAKFGVEGRAEVSQVLAGETGPGPRVATGSSPRARALYRS